MVKIKRKYSLGRSVTQTQSVSEEVAQKIDKEIRKLVDEGYKSSQENFD